MSRIGKLPIPLPQGVTVSITETDVTVTGPKGKLSKRFNPDMNIALQNNVIVVSRPSDNKEHRSLHGLTRSLLANMVKGVSTGFQRDLEIVGVGYRAEKAGEKLVLRVGLSQPAEVVLLPGVSFQLEGTNRIRVMGTDKETVGEMAARIRGIRPPDPYKGKGIRYAGEVVHLKPGKAGKVVGAK